MSEIALPYVESFGGCIDEKWSEDEVSGIFYLISESQIETVIKALQSYEYIEPDPKEVGEVIETMDGNLVHEALMILVK